MTAEVRLVSRPVSQDTSGFELRRGSRGGLILTLALVGVAVLHGFQLVELIGREDAAELAARALLDGMHLLFGITGCDRRIGAERGNLLVAIGEDGLELAGLVRREVELLGNPHGPAMRVGCAGRRGVRSLLRG